MFSRQEKPERKSVKGAIKKTRVKRDRDIPLPKKYQNTDKDICDLIRKCFLFPDNEDITEEVKRFSYIEEIEKELFEDSIDLEHLIVRLYMR